MNRTGVIFGAGNIGRGFIAQLFHESGLEVVFIDVQPDLVERLNRQGRYTIHIVGRSAGEVRITDVRAVDGRNRDSVSEEVARCEIACTAVGAGALPHIAANLAAGLARRQREGARPLNILVCENLHDAGSRVSALVAEHLADESRDSVLSNTGFIQAVVSRMVPLQESRKDDPLSIRVESYKRLPIDARAVVGRLPDLLGVEPVGNFIAHVERKLYTHNCAHAVLGYEGYARGITYAHEALVDRAVRQILDAVMADTGEALIGKHGFDREEHAAHVADLMERFANSALGDTCFRLARDPVRKLGPHDRLVGSARLCESQEIRPVALAGVIAVALRFDSAEDPGAAHLQRRIRSEGLDRVMTDVCGIWPDEDLAWMIRAGWDARTAEDEDDDEDDNGSAEQAESCRSC